MSLFNKTKEEILELEKKHNHIENCAKMDAKTSKKNDDGTKDNHLITHHIETLMIGCRIAQEKGVYTLEEARTIMNAIEALNSDK